MKVLEPGHAYQLDVLDKAVGAGNDRGIVGLRFVKRIGPGYPGNEAPPHSGTNCQEVVRALIDRVKYLDGQQPAPENPRIINHLREVLWLFERRAARRHGRKLMKQPKGAGPIPIEAWPTCRECGHCHEAGEAHGRAK